MSQRSERGSAPLTYDGYKNMATTSYNATFAAAQGQIPWKRAILAIAMTGAVVGFGAVLRANSAGARP
jgi:hypothetical protein